MASTNYDNNVRQLINIADIYGLHQLISDPTRITDKSSTLIDLIYTNCPEKVVCSGVAHISISDHSLIKAIKSNDPHEWANFKRMRNKVNTEIKAAKELFYNNKFTETNGDPRKTWQIIHDLTSHKAANLSIREINLNGTSISEPSDPSNAFNDHFSSIGPKLANDISLFNNNDHCHRKYVKGINNRFEFRPTDSGQVLKLLNKLNKSKGAETRRQKLKAEMVYKSLNGLAPNYLSSKFIQRSDVITSYNLRDYDNKLATPLPRTNHYKNSFAYSGAVLWNSLPSAARQATSLTNFRRFLINSDTAFM
ncbi:unnamed protein product [Porites lobata]|uniref:Uncharacterized protein n=1 Tax=Porites lobata TaxID=104759 RepID=A0ABN8QTJ4_9CNID|nr:unnamed protein product [Porites lobata]